MGIGIRVLLVDDDDSIKRFPLTRYERLLRRNPNERLPQYAGKRVRFAEVAVELEERKPVQIIRAVYGILPFDSEGRIDTAEYEKEMRLSAEMMPPILADRPSPKIVYAKHIFAKKRFDDQFRWEPTPQIEKSIVEAIFAKGRRYP
ncbi:MAG: hypothetical protein L6406_00390 [Desulfobacterales bacterium]|nr:hypothetical protein [Desulfobacterales bacterium]